MPPFDPAHDHAQGPVPATLEAVPTLQRPLVGAEVRVVPLAEPQAPLTGVWASGAEQEALLPPFDPEHDQSHGPLPVTFEAVPALHRPLLGGLLTATPLPLPHEPLTTVVDVVRVA